jgi:predicted enzyme related to lactoylglutathione lyase
MAKVLGVGGIFFKSSDPEALFRWYQQYLHLDEGNGPGIIFPPNDNAMMFSVFQQESRYFAPCRKEFMFNLVVDDLVGVLANVEQGGGEVVGDIQCFEQGRFGWFIDPDGNKVELWEPDFEC